MAIQEQKDPRTKKTFLEASGIVSGLYFNEIEADKRKSYPGKQAGQMWTPTHRINLVVDGDRISLGMKDFEGKEPQLRCKDADDAWQDVVRGTEVSIVVTTNGEYNGKPNYQAGAGDVIVTKVAPAGAGASGGGAPAAQSYQKKDMTGIHTGHAINVAIKVVGIEDADALIAAAQEAHALTEKLRAEYKAKWPDMSDYDLGASVGQAVLSAADFFDEIALIEPWARQTLDVIAPAVKKFIASTKEATPSKQQVTPAKKTTKAKPTTKPTPEPEPSGFDDFDDDIPF